MSSKDGLIMLFSTSSRKTDKETPIDEIIGAFNDDEEIDLSGKGSDITEAKFFKVKELDNNYGKNTISIKW